MAGSMKDIKLRIKSVEGTMQITKAMELVASSKLRRARQKVEQSRPYFEVLERTLTDIASMNLDYQSRYLAKREEKKALYVVIAGDRGLAGGYNSNIVKLVMKSDIPKEDAVIYAVGHKGLDALKRNGYHIEADWSDIVEEPAFADAMLLGKELLAKYAAGEIGEIYLAYTKFKNTVSHEPLLIKLLPVEVEEKEQVKSEKTGPEAIMNFEPEDVEALNMIIPKYINSLIYGGMVDSVASENGARMQAMDAATSNAEEMIDDLTLKYNRARQGSITQELTEIIAGAGAIS